MPLQQKLTNNENWSMMQRHVKMSICTCKDRAIKLWRVLSLSIPLPASSIGQSHNFRLSGTGAFTWKLLGKAEELNPCVLSAKTENAHFGTSLWLRLEVSTLANSQWWELNYSAQSWYAVCLSWQLRLWALCLVGGAKLECFFALAASMCLRRLEPGGVLSTA